MLTEIISHIQPKQKKYLVMKYMVGEENGWKRRGAITKDRPCW
jgi:hypothetical protein